MRFAAITGIGAYLPERVMTNADLEALVDTTDEWIVTRTGISERRVVAEEDTTSDLAARAVTDALDDSGLEPGQVDQLIVATSSPDMIFPSTAALAQRKAGLSCPAYDVMAACTGFVFALHTGVCAIESGRAERVVVAGADAFTRLVDFSDRSTCVLFGDGAAAVVLEASDAPGVMGIDLGTDGSGADMLMVPGGGAARPLDEERCRAGEQYVSMRGNEVFKFAVRVIPATAAAALEKSGVTLDEVRWLIPHQANRRIMDASLERMGLSQDRLASVIETTGNTSAASIPLAMHHLYTCGELSPGDVAVLVGFGAGLTWGAAVLRWTKEVR